MNPWETDLQFLTRHWLSAGTDYSESEDSWLRLIDNFFPSQTPHTPLGRGDDCAELAVSGGLLAVSTDLFIQDVHFRLEYTNPRELGAKALSQAASDLAGAGAQPLGFSLGLSIPANLAPKAGQTLLASMGATAERYGLALSGGDLCRSTQLMFSLTVWGSSISSDRPFFLQRGKAEPGDIIFLIGAAGLAHAGFISLERYGRQALQRRPAACKAFLNPLARLNEGKQVASFALEHGLQTRLSLMDVSDGLAQDLPRLTGPFGSKLQISAELLHPEALACAQTEKKDPLHFLLQGAEDYSLLGTVPPDWWESLHKMIPQAVPLGHVRKEPGMQLNRQKIFLKGFDHFRQTAPPCAGASPCPQRGRKLPAQADLLRAISRIQQTGQAAWQKGLLSGYNGNISLKLALPRRALDPARTGQAGLLQCCLITRSGSAGGQLQDTDFSLLELQTGRHLAGAEPSSEWKLHLAIYQACPDTFAVFHSHPVHLLALETLVPPSKRLILPLFESGAYQKQLAYVKKLPPGTKALSKAVAERALLSKALWLENHGLLVHGAGLDSLLALSEAFEHLAHVHILSLQSKKLPANR